MAYQYIAKEIKDGNGVVTGYENPVIVSGVVATKSYEARFLHTERFRHAVINRVSGEWQIEEDSAAKSSESARLTAVRAARNKLKTINADITAASSIATIKPILRDMARLIAHLVREG